MKSTQKIPVVRMLGDRGGCTTATRRWRTWPVNFYDLGTPQEWALLGAVVHVNQMDRMPL